MSAENKNNDKNYQTLIAVAIATAIVVLLCTAVLFTNYIKGVVVEPEREENLASLKKIIVDQPNNDMLIEHLRQKDLDFREDKFARLAASRKAAWLLLVAAAVMIASFKFALGLKAQLPSPSQQGDVSVEQVNKAIIARRTLWVVAVVLIAFSLVAILTPSIDPEKVEPALPAYPTMEEVYRNYPSFRGPAGDGVVEFINIPIEFDVESKRNILWSSPVSATGNSSPVVWGDKVFITGGDENKREVVCYDSISGDMLWQSELTVFGPAAELDIMEDTGYASCTPVTDGQSVYAIFANGHIGAFDFDGNKVWAQNLGTPDSMYGYASSLAIYQDTVIVQYDQAMAEDAKSKLIGINSATGKIKWQTSRDVPNSWTSPVLAEVGKSFQLITVADPFVIAYDPEDGTEIWRLECVTGDVAPSPIVSDGIVYAIEPDSEIYAIKAVEKNSTDQPKLLWSYDEGMGDIASPACDGTRLYLVSGSELTCVSIESKQTLYTHDLDDMIMASPAIVGDKVYILTDNGKLVVIETADTFKQLAVSEIGEDCYATPAFMDGKMFIRTDKNLYCISSKGQSE